MTYEPVISGDLISPTRTWYMRCCDCGLVHRIEFSRKVRLRVWREGKRTAAGRRTKRVIARIAKLAATVIPDRSHS